MGQQTLTQLTDALYTSALNPEAWDGWAAQVTEWLGGIAIGFTVWDRSTSHIRCQIMQHPSERLLDRYIAEEIWRLDPQMPVLHRNRRLTVFTDLDHLDRDESSTREYLRWQAANADMGHYLSVAAPLSADIAAGFSVHRRVADGVTPHESQRKLKALAPHVRRALKLGFVHTQLLNEAYWDGLLGDKREPALLLDERGRLLRVNPLGEELLKAADGLDCKNDRLVASNADSEQTLQRVVCDAVFARHPVAGAARILRLSGRAPFIISVFPLARTMRPLAPLEAAAIVTIVDPTRAPLTIPRLWRDAYSLTVREAALAAELVAGHSLESAAAVLEMRLATARAHLRSLFSKTGCGRQTDLVRLLSRIGSAMVDGSQW